MRKLLFGETWELPVGVFTAIAVAGLVRVLAGPHGWWREVGGFVLLAILFAVLVAAVRR